PDLGGDYEVIHHSTLIQEFIDEGKLRIQDGKAYQGKKITFHDSCYLGRANNVYEAPRRVIQELDSDLTEMKRSRKNGLCCGAGGAQVFKDAEKGNKEVNTERAEEAVATGADVVAMNCPFCMVMFQDAIKKLDKEEDIELKDIAEIAAESLG
ncbi:MAG: (Fe-S)-binding protein, partial [Bacteroidota bacterium]